MSYRVKYDCKGNVWWLYKNATTLLATAVSEPGPPPDPSIGYRYTREDHRRAAVNSQIDYDHAEPVTEEWAIKFMLENGIF
jgi:hypothetical protein